MGESHHDDSQQVHYSREKSNNRSSTDNSKYRNLMCNYCHKKEHIRDDYWLWKKKQPDANVTELIGEDEENVTFYLLQTDQLVTKIDRLLTLDIHSTSVLVERCSPLTLQLKREKSSWGILLQVRWLAKEQSSFGLIMDASLFFKAFVMFSRYNLISLGTL